MSAVRILPFIREAGVGRFFPLLDGRQGKGPPMLRTEILELNTDHKNHAAIFKSLSFCIRIRIEVDVMKTIIKSEIYYDGEYYCASNSRRI